MYKVVFDANIWIKYARAKDIAPLFDRIVKYNLIPIVNNYLLSEIFDTLVYNKWMTIKQATKLIQFIEKELLHIKPKTIAVFSGNWFIKHFPI